LLVYVGTFSAVLAVILGLLLANNEDYGGNTLSNHQWSGIATAALGIITLFFLSRMERQQKNYLKLYRGFLFFTSLGVSIAGHFGASLTHGEEYLTSVIPWSSSYSAHTRITFDFASFEGDSAEMNEEQEVKLVGEVRA